MKKILALLIAVVIVLASAFCVSAYEVDGSENFGSEIALLVSLDYGTVIYEKNADKVTAPSSLVKIVTAIMAIDYYGEDGLDTVITANETAILTVPFGSIASGLLTGEQLTVEQLLYYILVQSANDATHILAYQIGSDNLREGCSELESFVAMMNDFAKEHGCEKTVFSDCTGIDNEGNRSTAREIAKLSAYAAQNETFMKICGTLAYNMPATNRNYARTLTTGNNVIMSSSEYYYRYANGMKTGASDKGRCLVATSEKDGYNYLSVVMESPVITDDEGKQTNYSFKDTQTLLKWANDKLAYLVLVDENTVTGIEVDVVNGKKVDYVRLVPSAQIKELVPSDIKDSDIEFVIEDGAIPEKLEAAINKGDVVCKAKVMYNGRFLGEVDLVCANSVELSVGEVLRSFFTSGWGIMVILLIVVLVVVVILLRNFKKQSKKKGTIKVVKVKESE
ncbi:MAG: D-alanyl-D-alanine carboxypeptidase [Clostridia bacterium]|nr:D-alanyl-D-alanine carboxypeptidase [Clostridia bacterium]